MSSERDDKPGGEGRTPGGHRSGRTVRIENASELHVELAAMLRSALRPVLVILSGELLGRRIVVENTWILGRDPGADIVIEDEGISWRHLRIEDRGDGWTIVDLGSTNGTRVAGQRIEEHRLANGDVLTIGETLARVELRTAIECAHDDEMERILETDDLTGLMARRKFDEALDRLLRRAGARGQPLALLLMDLDGVKKINDTHGHLFGAYVIGESGKLIGRVVGDRGIACRFGGDEYLVAVPGADRDGGFAIAEEIHVALNAYEFVRQGIALEPGISLGVAAFPADASDATELFEKADAAMYRAKRSGGNRVST